jgi:hypothetical protein
MSSIPKIDDIIRRDIIADEHDPVDVLNYRFWRETLLEMAYNISRVEFELGIKATCSRPASRNLLA